MAVNTTLVDGFDPSDDRSHVIAIIVGTLVPFTTVIVGMRFYSRRFLSNSLGIDDWMSGWSMIMVIVTGSLIVLEAQTGLGRHRVFMTDEEYMNYNKIFYIDIVFYAGGLAFIKLHILLQYFRLFSVRMRMITIWVTVVSCLWGVASTLSCVFVCNPIAGFWDPGISAVCIPFLPQWYTNAVGNIITDLIIFALPIRVLWKLNLDRTQRLYLLAVFCLGFFTCCISIIRILFLNILQGDETYHNVTTAGWSLGEMCCGMVASCAPTLRPLWYQLAPSLRPSKEEDDRTDYLTRHTVGGRSVIRGDRSSSRVCKGAKNKGLMPSYHRGSSTLELTKAEDLEMTVGAARRPSEKSGDISSDSIAESEKGLTFPIQHPPTRTPSDDFLGLKCSTLTTVHASSEPPPFTRTYSISQGSGIHIQTDIIQKSGPALS